MGNTENNLGSYREYSSTSLYPQSSFIHLQFLSSRRTMVHKWTELNLHIKITLRFWICHYLIHSILNHLTMQRDRFLFNLFIFRFFPFDSSPLTKIGLKNLSDRGRIGSGTIPACMCIFYTSVNCVSRRSFSVWQWLGNGTDIISRRSFLNIPLIDSMCDVYA